MSDTTPSPGPDTGLPSTSDLQEAAVMLLGLIQGAEILANETSSKQYRHAGNALIALFPEMLAKCDSIANGLDRLDTPPQRQKAAAPAASNAPAVPAVPAAFREAYEATDWALHRARGLAIAAYDLAVDHPSLQADTPENVALCGVVGEIQAVIERARELHEADWRAVMEA